MVISVTMERAVMASRRRNDEKATLFSTSLELWTESGSSLRSARIRQSVLFPSLGGGRSRRTWHLTPYAVSRPLAQHGHENKPEIIPQTQQRQHLGIGAR
jgi:hypothetical protein